MKMSENCLLFHWGAHTHRIRVVTGLLAGLWMLNAIRIHCARDRCSGGIFCWFFDFSFRLITTVKMNRLLCQCLGHYHTSNVWIRVHSGTQAQPDRLASKSRVKCINFDTIWFYIISLVWPKRNGIACESGAARMNIEHTPSVVQRCSVELSDHEQSKCSAAPPSIFAFAISTPRRCLQINSLRMCHIVRWCSDNMLSRSVALAHSTKFVSSPPNKNRPDFVKYSISLSHPDFSLVHHKKRNCQLLASAFGHKMEGCHHHHWRVPVILTK